MNIVKDNLKCVPIVHYSLLVVHFSPFIANPPWLGVHL